MSTDTLLQNMTPMHDSILKSLNDGLSIQYIELINESNQHSGPRDAETHFKLVCVAPEFDSLSRVKRHQKIYGLLSDQMASGVHALALHLFSPQEWLDSNQVPDSPNCLGGSKG